ncbi:PAC2 family protein [Humibacter soli]
MQDPRDLYDVRTALETVPTGLYLVAGLTGFADAGNAVSQLSTYLTERLDAEEIVRFDADALLDYRARRPIITFDQDHISDYQPSQLSLYLVRDEVGQQFLLLTGYEPDFQWERFSTAVLDLVSLLKVRSTIWVHAIPMPVPHTRPIGVTVSGNREGLAESMSVWRPTTQAPATAMHLIEYRLQEVGASTVGFVLLVPHYLGDTEYPAAAVAAIENISSVTGLIFPTDKLREEDREFIANIDEQVSNNPELERLVGALEQRHDTYMQDSPLKSPLTHGDGGLPSADEIAAELENFLAYRRKGDDDQQSH